MIISGLSQQSKEQLLLDSQQRIASRLKIYFILKVELLVKVLKSLKCTKGLTVIIILESNGFVSTTGLLTLLFKVNQQLIALDLVSNGY